MLSQSMLPVLVLPDCRLMWAGDGTWIIGGICIGSDGVDGRVMSLEKHIIVDSNDGSAGGVRL